MHSMHAIDTHREKEYIFVRNLAKTNYSMVSMRPLTEAHKLPCLKSSYSIGIISCGMFACISLANLKITFKVVLRHFLSMLSV